MSSIVSLKRIPLDFGGASFWNRLWIAWRVLAGLEVTVVAALTVEIPYLSGDEVLS
jgi:hypothetical protein